MRQQRIGWMRTAGFLAGVAVAVVAVLAWQIPRGTGSLGADLLVAVSPTGELAVSQPGPFLSATAMRPGSEDDAAEGTFVVRNISASTLSVRIRALVSIGDLDELLWIGVAAGDDELYRGPVGGLEDASQAFRLASDERATLAVRTWLPETVDGGFEGRIANVDLTFLPTVVTS